MSTRVSPCGWVPDAPCSVGPCCPDTTDPVIKARAEAIAASILWRLTGMQFGCCELTVRPCKPITCDPLTLSQIIYWDQRYMDGRAGNLGVLSYFPTLLDGQIFNIACGCPTGCCTCKADCEVKLPGPVCAISKVTVDGIDLSADQYYLLDDRSLVIKTLTKPTAHVSHVALSPNGPVHDPSERVCFSVPVTPTNTAPSGPCYVSSGVSNMTFDVSSQLTYDVDYTVTEPFQGSVMAITDGGVSPTDVYVLTPNIALNPGDTVTSTLATDGSFIRLTIISGATATNPSGRLILTGDVSYSVEFLATAPGCPPCQNYNKQLNEAGTWSVTYTLGTPVPDDLNFAAGLYACQIALAMVGNKACTLPDRVASVTRQGMTETFWDPILLTEAGLTGIPLVDRIVQALNPYGMRQPSRVWYPGMPVTRHETT